MRGPFLCAKKWVKSSLDLHLKKKTCRERRQSVFFYMFKPIQLRYIMIYHDIFINQKSNGKPSYKAMYL